MKHSRICEFMVSGQLQPSFTNRWGLSRSFSSLLKRSWRDLIHQRLRAQWLPCSARNDHVGDCRGKKERKHGNAEAAGTNPALVCSSCVIHHCHPVVRLHNEASHTQITVLFLFYAAAAKLFTKAWALCQSVLRQGPEPQRCSWWSS